MKLEWTRYNKTPTLCGSLLVVSESEGCFIHRRPCYVIPFGRDDILVVEKKVDN